MTNTTSVGFNPIVVPGGTFSATGFFGAKVLWSDFSPSDVAADQLSNYLTHPATDIVAALHTEVDAFAGGEAIYGYLPALGWYVRVHTLGTSAPTVADGHDFYTLYAHLGAEPLVTNGRVEVGQKIGEVGTDGTELGVPSGSGLLHLEIQLFNDVNNPTYHPFSWSAWDLPRLNADGSTYNQTNTYIYGTPSVAQLRADPDGTNLGYVNPGNFLSENGDSHSTVVFTDSVQQDPIVGTGLASVQGVINKATNFIVQAAGHAVEVVRADTGAVFAQFQGFSEWLFNGGALKDIVHILPLGDGSDITKNTIFFNGNDGDDELDASMADKTVVASGGNGNDTLLGGSETMC